MTTYGEKHQRINLNYGDAPNNDYDKILNYNKEVGTSAQLPTGTCRSGYDHMEDANVMTDMWVKVEEKIKMCRYENLNDTNEPTGESLYPPVFIVWKYYGNGNHVILKPYENSKGDEYIMVKGKRHYLSCLTNHSVKNTDFEWDYHYHYGNIIPALMGQSATDLVVDKKVEENDIIISKEILMLLIQKNKQIYNKNIELSIALMKTTATLEELLNI